VNIIAFMLVVVAVAMGVVIIVQSGGKAIAGWGIALLGIGVLIQECAIDWEKTIHF
jgi:hypothetical protein